MPTPISPTLSPIVQPTTPGSLTLLTSVLDATSNWILLRYIYAALRPEKLDGHSWRARASSTAVSVEEENLQEKHIRELNVILISFLRPFELWREMGKKIVRLAP